MPRLAFAVVGLAVYPLLGGAALASAGMVCDALDHSGATLEMNLPRAPGTAPNWVRINANGKFFSSLPIDEKAIVIANRQSFEDDDSFSIDLSDQAWSDEPTIRIRLLKAVEGDAQPLYFGYLHVSGDGITPISCIQDE